MLLKVTMFTGKYVRLAKYFRKCTLFMKIQSFVIQKNELSCLIKDQVYNLLDLLKNTDDNNYNLGNDTEVVAAQTSINFESIHVIGLSLSPHKTEN